MKMRYLYIIMFGAMLGMAANLMPVSEAKAMAAGCCCPPGECQCCCSRDVPEEPPAALSASGTATPETCTCSTGPEPYRVPDASSDFCLDPPKKRFVQQYAPVVDGVCSVSAGLPAKRHKPPAVSSQRLYILKSSFLI